MMHGPIRIRYKKGQFKYYMCIILHFEERSLRVFENRVLRRMFGPKRDEVTGEWRKVCGELNDLYCSPNIVQMNSRRMQWSGHVAHVV